MDIDTKVLKKNAFRVTKERGLTASRIRVPGGHMDAKYLSMIQTIAETYGNGTVHITSRQGFELPGIRFEDMPQVNEMLQPVIEGLGINHLHSKLKRQYTQTICISRLPSRVAQMIAQRFGCMILELWA